MLIYDIKSSCRTYNDKQFLSLYEYLSMARKIISSFAPPGFKSKMLNDEDAISFVAEQLMEGTNRFTEEHNCTLSTYYTRCGKWAIGKWCDLTCNSKKRNKKLVHLSTVVNAGGHKPMYLSDTIMDKHNNNDFQIETLRHFSLLTDKQKECLKMRFLDNMTYSKIAAYMGCSRQGAQYFVNQALTKLRL